MLQHAPVDGTAFEGDRLESLWWEAALQPDGSRHMCLWESGFKSPPLELCLMSTAQSQAAVFSVSSSFSVLWLASLFCLIWFFSTQCEGEGVANTPALEIYSVWEHVFCPFSSYSKLRYGSPGGKKGNISSLEQTSRVGMFRSLAPILILLGMYLMLICISLFSSFLSACLWKGLQEDANVVMTAQAGSQ